MEKVLIISDDLTGANANCALMKKIGLRAASFLGTNAEQIPKNIEVIAATTDSRAMTKSQAYREVFNKIKIFRNHDICLYSKRIDSTLRGNLGTELQAYQDSFDRKKVGICVPAYPNSGRIVIDGRLFVNGHLLLNTDAGNDPKMPVVSNYVEDNFKKDYEGRIKTISINEIEKGKDNLADLMKKYSEDYDLLIFDSINNEHIKKIAEATFSADIEYIAVDPGPFTMELTNLIYKSSSISTKALAVIGSVTQITIEQLKKLKQNVNHYQINVNPHALLSMDTIEDELTRCSEEVKNNLDDSDLIIITTTPDDIKDRLDLYSISKEKNITVDDISLILSRGLANIAKNVLENNRSFSGVFSSGGDITVALAEEVLSTGIEIREEVMPLAAYGRLIGGLYPGLKVVSKGGMVGNEDAMIECVEKILKLED